MISKPQVLKGSYKDLDICVEGTKFPVFGYPLMVFSPVKNTKHYKSCTSLQNDEPKERRKSSWNTIANTILSSH